MQRVEPKYEHLVEMDEVLKSLKEKYPDVFFAVNLPEVGCYCLVNKPRPDSKAEEVTITGASGVFGKINPVKYLLTVYASDWSVWNESQKAIYVAKAIKRISVDGGGKLNRYDEMNHRCFLDTFGLGYEDNIEMPNILKEDIKWVL
jgi:hypothetical protein